MCNHCERDIWYNANEMPTLQDSLLLQQRVSNMIGKKSYKAMCNRLGSANQYMPFRADFRLFTSGFSQVKSTLIS
jgi:hypothetical protein